MKDTGICNIALVQLGCEPISSFDDGTTEAMVTGNLYPILKESLLCMYPWRFCTFDEDLARLSETPKSQYKYFYQLPNDFLTARSLMDSRSGHEADFGIVRDRIVTDAEEPVLTYTFNIKEDLMPQYFVNVLANYISARACMALTEDMHKASMWMKIFDDSYRTARNQDSQQATTQCFSSSILLDVRG